MTTQRLVLRNFPRPSVARAISPNGRSHYMARAHAVRAVHTHVQVMAVMDGLEPMHGLVTVQPVYIVPDARRRDPDNYTAMLKSVIDGVVHGGYLADDDSEHVRLMSPKFRVERGLRRLELLFDWSDTA